MAMTETELNDWRDSIMTSLKDMADTPLPSYKRGTLTMSWNEYHKALLEDLKRVETSLANLPCEEITIFDDPDT